MLKVKLSHSTRDCQLNNPERFELQFRTVRATLPDTEPLWGRLDIYVPVMTWT
ncbi:MAG: hypothetical protein P4L49_07745 [Desulfosporosinus sp.]|nr:hypothetical protein [Desulfosporosinus sp.]